MANPFEEDDQQHSISMKRNALEDSMLDSTRRALNMLVESEDIGIESATVLVDQGEALDRIEKKLGNIDVGLSATQKNITKLKSPFGAFSAKLFGSTRSMFSSKSLSPTTTKSETNLNKYLNARGDVASNNDQSVKPGMPQSSSFRQLTGTDREREVEQNLDTMSSYLTRLKGLASNMGEEIDRQNVMISTIKDSSEKVESRMTGQREALQKLLKK